MDALRAAAAEGEAQQDEAIATARQELQLVDEQLYEAAHDMRDARRRPPLTVWQPSISFATDALSSPADSRHWDVFIALCGRWQAGAIAIAFETWSPRETARYVALAAVEGHISISLASVAAASGTVQPQIDALLAATAKAQHTLQQRRGLFRGEQQWQRRAASLELLKQAILGRSRARVVAVVRRWGTRMRTHAMVATWEKTCEKEGHATALSAVFEQRASRARLLKQSSRTATEQQRYDSINEVERQQARRLSHPAGDPQEAWVGSGGATKEAYRQGWEGVVEACDAVEGGYQEIRRLDLGTEAANRAIRKSEARRPAAEERHRLEGESRKGILASQTALATQVVAKPSLEQYHIEQAAARKQAAATWRLGDALAGHLRDTRSRSVGCWRDRMQTEQRSHASYLGMLSIAASAESCRVRHAADIAALASLTAHGEKALAAATEDAKERARESGVRGRRALRELEARKSRLLKASDRDNPNHNPNPNL